MSFTNGRMTSDHRHSPYPSARTRHSSSKTPQNASARPTPSEKKQKRTAVVLTPDTELVTIDPRGDVVEELHLGLYHITKCFAGNGPPQQCQLHSLYTWIISIQDLNMRNTRRNGIVAWKKPSEILRSLDKFENKLPAPEVGCGIYSPSM